MSNLIEKNIALEKINAKAQKEYLEIVEIAKTHIAAATKIIDSNGLVPFIKFTEGELLALLKQLYKEGAAEIRQPNPKIDYQIKGLNAPENLEPQEVDYEIV